MQATTRRNDERIRIAGILIVPAPKTRPGPPNCVDILQSTASFLVASVPIQLGEGTTGWSDIRAADCHDDIGFSAAEIVHSHAVSGGFPSVFSPQLGHSFPGFLGVPLVAFPGLVAPGSRPRIVGSTGWTHDIRDNQSPGGTE